MQFADTSMNLADFIGTYGEAIKGSLSKLYPPHVELGRRPVELPNLKRNPLGRQADALKALEHSLKVNKGTLLVAEMGSGKTYQAIVAAQLVQFKRVLVLCPPHLVEKWVREVQVALQGVHAQVVRSLSDLEEIHRTGRDGFFVMSRETAKLGSYWEPVLHYRSFGHAGSRYKALCCPACGQELLEKEERLHRADLEDTKRYCKAEIRGKDNRCEQTTRTCNAPLWQVSNQGPRRYPLGEYIKRKMPRGFFGLLILDEVQEYKATESAQGRIAGSLAEVCGRSLALTGTLYGGYASNLFSLLHRFSPAIRKQFNYSEEARFIQYYGLVEEITTYAEQEDGRSSGRKSATVRSREIPGVSPLLLPRLLDNVVYLRLSDISDHLPSYSEDVVMVELGAQREAYREFEGALTQKVKEALRMKDRRLLGAMLQSLLHYCDTPYRGEEITVKDKFGKRHTVLTAPALSAEEIYPKEGRLLEDMRAEREQGRRVWVYVQGTEKRDITKRLRDLLTERGYRVAVLKSTTVPAEKREAWVERQVNAGVDVVICHPKLVQTGLDLIDFQTFIFYQGEISTYVMRQASRRGWRIPQKQAVKVLHYVYAGTLQERMLSLIARKAQCSLALEGELSSTGLDSMVVEDTFLALAKSLVRAEKIERVVFSTVEADRMIGENPPVTALATAPKVVSLSELPQVVYFDAPVTLGTGRRKKVVGSEVGMLFDVRAA